MTAGRFDSGLRMAKWGLDKAAGLPKIFLYFVFAHLEDVVRTIAVGIIVGM